MLGCSERMRSTKLRAIIYILDIYLYFTSILNLYEEMASLTVGEESCAQFAVIAIARNGPCLREENVLKTNC